jgi:RNA polymerase sigma-70 factor (ECF subfamily)
MDSGAGSDSDQGYSTLLSRVRAGDPAAIDDLLHRALAVAQRYSQAVCGRAPDTDDAVQEALLRTFRYAGNIREPRAFRAWLYRTVKNACLVGRRRAVAEPAMIESLDDANRGGPDPSDATPAADEMVAASETREAVRRALDRLPAAYREVIFLRDLEGLSTREVAQVLAISQANVKVRLHRAHRQLRRALEPRSPSTSVRSASSGPSRRKRTP